MRARLLFSFLLAVAVLAPACQVDSYCLDCKRDDHDGGGDDDDHDGGGDGDASDSGPPPDACAVTSAAEVCDGFDNDCNGLVDDAVPEVGTACQENAMAPCTPGVYACTAGHLVCSGAITPTAETCNDLDDDCDGVKDNGNPGGGVLCGTAEGDCVQGLTACQAGDVVCVGATEASPELCDNRDNDCDGVIDNGNPGGGGTCGTDQGVCTAGTLTCSGGVVRCEGASNPTLEQCNQLDDDCDGMVDDGFNLNTDKNNCGACGNVCSAANAVAKCTGGGCGIAFCLTDYWDNTGGYANGCEYHCEFNGQEVCNGVDDDCDGQIDEGVVAPTNLCAKFGECATSTATCTGTGGFVCNYAPTVSTDGTGNIIPETKCDGKDNDCDGDVDETFPTKGNACANSGVGVCQGQGSLTCNAAGTALTCNITTPGQPSSLEVCDGKDNDCDGTVDDNAKDNWIAISGGGISGTKYIFQYEASRPDAAAASQGLSAARACSNANVLPWTDATFPQAEAACAAAGGRLCSETEWQRACNTSQATACTWGMDSCTAYDTNKCNGNDFDSGAAVGDQDQLLKTKQMAACYADWGTVATRIFDMSGNAKEWAQTAAGDPANTRRLRGGSFNNTQNGISCNFRFAVADDSFHFQNVGFRCCRDTAPPTGL